MPGRILLLCLLSVGLAACQSARTAPPEEALDPFTVAIDAERWGVLIDRAHDGLIESGAGERQLADDNILRADTALKSGAARLILLRNDVCRRGLLSWKDCELGAWPAWTQQAPSSKTPLEVLDRRSQWLGAEMQRFTEVGCNAGRGATDDDLYCSVE
ncbi:MAG: hypothetical protein GC155_04310 [Alphaproteobacteria bacterium]|nr:hypothetical protein [Alphaproteobacteria bacterium]